MKLSTCIELDSIKEYLYSYYEGLNPDTEVYKIRHDHIGFGNVYHYLPRGTCYYIKNGRDVELKIKVPEYRSIEMKRFGHTIKYTIRVGYVIEDDILFITDWQ